jgi:hypothetical protein
MPEKGKGQKNKEPPKKHSTQNQQKHLRIYIIDTTAKDQ